MDNLILSIKNQLNERFSSPLFGAFLLSWLGWNHKYLFILFSDTDIQTKLDLANGYYPGLICALSYGFVFPLGTAVLFILLYPFPALWLFSFWHARQKKIKEQRDKIDDLTPLTLEESNRLRRRLYDLQNDFNETIQQQAVEIEELKKQTQPSTKSPEFREAKPQPSTYLRPTQKTLDEIPEGVIKLITHLTKSNGSSLDRYFFNEVKPQIKHVTAQHYIDLAKQFNFITTLNNGNDIKIELTNTGRTFAVTNKLV